MIAAIGVALAIVGSGTSGPATSYVSPNSALDQSNPSRASACRYTGWVPDAATDWAAQTFTAGVSGNLTDVVVWLRVFATGVAAAITPVDTGGQPLVSAPLSSVTVPVAPNQVFSEVEISFPTPARVQAGTQYALVLSNPTGSGQSNWGWKADVGSSVRDPNGVACADGAYAGGRMWVSSAPIGADADFFFRSYVVPARRVSVQRVGTGTGLVQDDTRALDCGSACSSEFLQGRTLTLTATPDPGSTFSGWSGGGCTGTAPMCSVTVEGDLSLTAEFTRKLVSLTVRKLGRGTVASVPAGITCGQRCSHRFVPGPVKLTAKPFAGWRFVRWQGGCRGTKPTCQLRLLRAGTVTALFVRTPPRK